MDKKIKQYIDKQKSPQREAVVELRRLIKKSAPLAEEAMSYGVPAFKLNGHLLVAYAAFKHHLGLYPEPEIIKIFEKALKNYKTSKGAIQFNLDRSIPFDLIKEIIKYKYKKLIE